MAFNSALERAIRLNDGRPIRRRRRPIPKNLTGIKPVLRINSLSGVVDIVPAALSPSQIINRHTSTLWGLEAYPGQPAPTYTERRYGGLGAADGPAYETVMIRVGPQHHPAAFGVKDTGLGSWLSQFVKHNAKIVGKIASVVAIALPVIGSIVPGIGTWIGGLAGGLVKKATAIAAQLKPALQAGGKAVQDVAAQVSAAKAEALRVANDPKSDPTTRAQAKATYDYYVAVELSLKKASNTLQGAAIGAGIGAKAGAAGTDIMGAFASLPPWAIPAAIAGGVLLLTRRRGR